MILHSVVGSLTNAFPIVYVVTTRTLSREHHPTISLPHTNLPKCGGPGNTDTGHVGGSACAIRSCRLLKEHLMIMYYPSRFRVAMSRYSEWLRDGRPKGRSSSPGKVKNFLFSASFRLVLGSHQPSTPWVPGALSPGVERLGREEDYSPPTSAVV
jgi:hypothetical protein